MVYFFQSMNKVLYYYYYYYYYYYHYYYYHYYYYYYIVINYTVEYEREIDTCKTLVVTPILSISELNPCDAVGIGYL